MAYIKKLSFFLSGLLVASLFATDGWSGEKTFLEKIYFKAGIHLIIEDDLKFDDDDDDLPDILPAYQIMTDLSYESKQHPSVKLNLGYNYSSLMNDRSFNSNSYNEQEYSKDEHNIIGALSFQF